MRVVALSGGVGGARLLDGLSRALPAGALTAIVNTGDDFVHLGLNVSPDLDTVMYTLSGLADEERGWGLTGETFAGLGMVKRYGGPAWFGLGNRDLATHLLRTEWLRAGESLSGITARLCAALGIPHPVLPMSDAPVATMIETAVDGTLPFQQWFVKRRAEPAVRAVRFEGGRTPAPGSSRPSTRARWSSSGHRIRTCPSIPSCASMVCGRRSHASPSSPSAPSSAARPSRGRWRP